MEKIIGNVDKPSLSIEDTTPIVCECGNKYFTEVLEVRKISKLIIGAPNDQLVHIPGLMCTKCQKVLNLDEIIK